VGAPPDLPPQLTWKTPTSCRPCFADASFAQGHALVHVDWLGTRCDQFAQARWAVARWLGRVCSSDWLLGWLAQRRFALVMRRYCCARHHAWPPSLAHLGGSRATALAPSLVQAPLSLRAPPNPMAQWSRSRRAKIFTPGALPHCDGPHTRPAPSCKPDRDMAWSP
jgi:hypothetical protein